MSPDLLRLRGGYGVNNVQKITKRMSIDDILFVIEHLDIKKVYTKSLCFRIFCDIISYLTVIGF